MPIDVACQCGKRFRARDDLAGRQVNCPGCGQVLTIGQPGGVGTSWLDEFDEPRSSPQPTGETAGRATRGKSGGGLDGKTVNLLLLGGAAAALVVFAVVVLSYPTDDGAPAGNLAAGGDPVADAVEPPASEEAAGAALAELEAQVPDEAVTTDVTPPVASEVLEQPEGPAEVVAPQESPPVVEPPQAPASRPGPPSGSSAGPSSESTIRLSAGVALPQTLPTGTAVGISVDYQFTQGGPAAGANYVWVIEAAGNNETIKQPVQLSDRGTLQGFTPFRPEHGPFSTHIENYKGTRLSKSVSLR